MARRDSVGAPKVEEDKPMVYMNTTPLIDVLLVLLIMFILTIPIQTHATKLDLPPPVPAPPSDIKPEFNTVVIDFLNNTYWNDQPVSRAQLRGLFRRIGELPGDTQPETRFHPDPLAKWEVVDGVLADAQQFGVDKMGFVGNEAYAVR